MARAEPPYIAPPESFLTRQLITYIGNKRALLPFIDSAFAQVQAELGHRRMSMLDLFSGSGVVARLMKSRASLVWANDLETYAQAINRCFLANPSAIDHAELARHTAAIAALANERPSREGFIRRLYAPADEQRISPEDRVFYTVRNAQVLDSCAPAIRALPAPFADLLMGPLLSAASRHVNTAGVFKGFYKDRAGTGRFGGAAENALSRILAPIAIEPPVLFEAPAEARVTALPAETLVEQMEPVDCAYLDPPYNQHPYGSNYFMLNAIARYEEPQEASRVSGIPKDWNRSAFNKPATALEALTHCVAAVRARFVVISYNSEGFIAPEAMTTMLERFGSLRVTSQEYPTFRGSRNLAARDKSVREFVFLLDKG
ncbi:adenine-specific DNA-methyltransferase [Altererythrobacter xiamenensis]|uniref:site-specific DNA-methyltransferase (adenine-specific) n=1 Tax=Altererythrobacter xiamenensis TaxID=1316679 RepID=A0A1Y6EBW2_9SPHN|nr:DNA adenine methylase [Altererythrobacter xiamenensis]SMQ58102.1 adenine-specific DNA-methyltransferase [Altererythrobacter xiamenensis]